MFNFLRRSRDVVDAENHLTPLEIQRELRKGRHQREAFAVAGLLDGQPPKRFRRTPLVPGVTLYSAGAGAGRLIVGFTGTAARLMTPISVFLQLIDDGANDVLLLRDASRRQYSAGIPGFGTSLLELSQEVDRLAQRSGYGSVVTFGTSAGGLPSLRAGRHLGASRAISVGGRFAWHVERLAAPASQIGAFDPLCQCIASPVPCLALYSGLNAPDRASADILARRLPSCRFIAAPLDEHNLINAVFQTGRLGALYGQLFSDAPDLGAVEALLA